MDNSENDEWLIRLLAKIQKKYIFLIGVICLITGILIDVLQDEKIILVHLDKGWAIALKVISKVLYALSVILLVDCILHFTAENKTKDIQDKKMEFLIQKVITQYWSNEKMKETIVSALVDKTILNKKVRELGIKEIINKANTKALADLIRKSKRIDFIKIWIDLDEEIIEALYHAITVNDIKVRIAVLKRELDDISYDKGTLQDTIFNLRLEQLPDQNEVIKAASVAGIKALVMLNSKLPYEKRKNIELFHYVTLPTLSVIRIDDDITFSLYFFHKRSEYTPQIKVSKAHEGQLYELLNNHIESYFKHNNPDNKTKYFSNKEEITSMSNFIPENSKDIGDDVSYVTEFIKTFQPKTTHAEITSIKGIVIDKETLLPIEGAEIMINPLGKSLVTSVDGQYEFKGITDGKLNLVIDHVNYKTKEIDNIELKKSEVNRLEIKLSKMLLASQSQ